MMICVPSEGNNIIFSSDFKIIAVLVGFSEGCVINWIYSFCEILNWQILLFPDIVFDENLSVRY